MSWPEMSKQANISTVETADLWYPVLRQLGVEPGGTLIFHASFSTLSRRGFSAERVLEALMSFLDTGTLAVPTLSWKEVSPSRPVFDELVTWSNVGVLSEVFRTRFATRRSLHPTHSVAAAGPMTDHLLADHQHDVRPCSQSSPWGRLSGVGAKVLLIGVDMDSCTLLHHLEETFDPDRYLCEEVESYRCMGRDASILEVATRRHRKLLRNFWKFREMLDRREQLRVADLSGTRIYAFAAADLVDGASKLFEQDPCASLAGPGEPSKLM
jgi:aminoglycoside 3-N-acetyltransferase